MLHAWRDGHSSVLVLCLKKVCFLNFAPGSLIDKSAMKFLEKQLSMKLFMVKELYESTSKRDPGLWAENSNVLLSNGVGNLPDCNWRHHIQEVN